MEGYRLWTKKNNLLPISLRSLGSKNVLTDATALSVYECDAAPSFKAMPDVVVFADTAQQVSDIVKLANKYDTPFIARGGGTGLSGGMLSVQGGIIIALNRMDRILEIDLENERAVIEPGVVNLLLTQAVQNQGYHYAPDPSSQKACTIGGNIAENSGGPHTLKYGVTSDHVLGLEVVLPNGEIIELGGAVERNTRLRPARCDDRFRRHIWNRNESNRPTYSESPSIPNRSRCL